MISLEARLPGENPEVYSAVLEVIKAVKRNGSGAVLDFRKKFEEVSIEEPLLFNVTQDLREKALHCSPDVLAALRLSIERVRRFHEIQVDSSKTLSKKNQNAKISAVLSLLGFSRSIALRCMCPGARPSTQVPLS